MKQADLNKLSYRWLFRVRGCSPVLGKTETGCGVLDPDGYQPDCQNRVSCSSPGASCQAASATAHLPPCRPAARDARVCCSRDQARAAPVAVSSPRRPAADASVSKGPGGSSSFSKAKTADALCAGRIATSQTPECEPELPHARGTSYKYIQIQRTVN